MKTEFDFSKIVEDLKEDANRIAKVLSQASEFHSSIDFNRYPAAIKSLKETLTLIRDYDWHELHSVYTTGADNHREIALWEQNGQGEIRDKKRFIVLDEENYQNYQGRQDFEDEFAQLKPWQGR